jgi:SAM-dependent methyltransferase
MAQRGPVHAIDTFKWTSAHEKRVGQVVSVTESFLQVFKSNVADCPNEITTYEGDVETFSWDGPPFDFCLIDSAKTAKELGVVLQSVLPCLRDEATVMLINGQNPKYLDMVGFISGSIHAGVFRAHDIDGATKSKARVLRLDNKKALGGYLERKGVDGAVHNSDLIDREKLSTPEVIAAISGFVEKNRWGDAYQLLSFVAKDEATRELWEIAESKLSLDKVDPQQLGYFSHIVDASYQAATRQRVPGSMNASPVHAIEEFWFRNKNQPWRAQAFYPELILRAQNMGYLRWPAEIADHLSGKRVLDVGCGRTLHSIGVLTAGATSYLGIDPELRLDTDKIKDLVTKKKVRFGCNGHAISKMFPPISFLQCRVEDLQVQDQFDVALMHMVTPHLHDLETALSSTASHLVEGGKLIIKHRNFYAWNGHQGVPNTIDAIDLSDPRQRDLIDWEHLNFDPPEEHYIARKLNRATLGELREALLKAFDILVWEPTLSTAKQGLGRLNDDIRSRYPALDDEDFETQSVLCIAIKRQIQAGRMSEVGHG